MFESADGVFRSNPGDGDSCCGGPRPVTGYGQRIVMEDRQTSGMMQAAMPIPLVWIFSRKSSRNSSLCGHKGCNSQIFFLSLIVLLRCELPFTGHAECQSKSFKGLARSFQRAKGVPRSGPDNEMKRSPSPSRQGSALDYESIKLHCFSEDLLLVYVYLLALQC